MPHPLLNVISETEGSYFFTFHSYLILLDDDTEFKLNEENADRENHRIHRLYVQKRFDMCMVCVYSTWKLLILFSCYHQKLIQTQFETFGKRFEYPLFILGAF